MPETLLKLDEVARRLAISRRTFYRIRPRLVAKGLQEITVGHRRRYREQSLDRLIQRAGEIGGAL